MFVHQPFHIIAIYFFYHCLYLLHLFVRLFVSLDIYLFLFLFISLSPFLASKSGTLKIKKKKRKQKELSKKQCLAFLLKHNDMTCFSQ